jgi:CHASE3 domain sensor protein
MKKIRTKLLIAMLAIAITIAAILSIVSIYSINQSTQGTMEDSVKPLAFQSAKNFNTTIRQYT